MRKVARGRLLLATAAVGSAVLISGIAQAAGADSPDSTQDGSGKLEMVVVTAQKREESQQSVPVSLQVISSETLAQQNRDSLQDLAETVPGLHIVSRASADLINIRGTGSGEDS